MTSPTLDELKNVSGIGPAAIEKFRDAGFETLTDVADATLDEITAVPGIGETTAQTILEYVAEEVGTAADEQGDSDTEHDVGGDSRQSGSAAEIGDDGDVTDEAEEQSATEEPSDTVDEQAPASENGEGTTSPAQSQEEITQHLSEELSPEHLRLLRVFHDPQRWAQEHEQEYPQTQFLELSTVLEHAVPEWRKNQTQYDQLWHDLYRHGLVTTESLHVMTSRSGALAGRTSDLGHAVLSYAEE